MLVVEILYSTIDFTQKTFNSIHEHVIKTIERVFFVVFYLKKIFFVFFLSFLYLIGTPCYI